MAQLCGVGPNALQPQHDHEDLKPRIDRGLIVGSVRHSTSVHFVDVVASRVSYDVALL
jgi:hypothetical protein